MAKETVRLAEYAASVRYEDLPVEMIGRATDCVADTAADARVKPSYQE